MTFERFVPKGWKPPPLKKLRWWMYMYRQNGSWSAVLGPVEALGVPETKQWVKLKYNLRSIRGIRVWEDER